MKKTTLVLLTLSAIAASAQAQSLPGDDKPATKIEQPKRTHFSVGATTHHEKYEEFDSGSKVMQETANLTGITAGVSRDIWAASSVSASLTYATGQSEYTGSSWDNNTQTYTPYGSVISSGQDRQFIDFKTQMKLSAPAWRQTRAIVGLGYRKLTDHLEQSGPGGYERINRRIYATLGAEHEFKFGTNWTITPRGQYMPIIKGENYSDSYGGITHKQQGYGLEAAVDFAFNKDRFSFSASPFYRRWNVDVSDTLYFYDTSTSTLWSIVEPKNVTNEYGVAISVGF